MAANLLDDLLAVCRADNAQQITSDCNIEDNKARDKAV